ncbi:HWE histidine kinase domain-containing protein [Neorhizobium alkalisoli]|uniref:histidine kinase n=1 Tax=Neorhizobium alkalisoli TaxID=528178 RepID=A0A561QHJ1_9HYPH|nr:HWE histidine kinase domain-containing protein [Neorhizobium alkalisoli]TWF49828.1 light-regulated signal transduction histidine kinase (bacteriophytochrome) [Neorhizobium alkalisoli]
MNRPTVDLTNCDREPIHLLGAIQPIGFLLSLTLDWIIARASANIAEFIKVDDGDLVGRPLSEIFLPETIHSLRNRLATLRGANAVDKVFDTPLTPRGQPFDIAIHISSGQIVIEAQPSAARHGDATSMVRSMISRLDVMGEASAFYTEGARQVRALTGFDRVMVYRFAEDGSGEVVAETCKPGIGSFKGLHYPASDIPVQARELYKRNLLRVISDVDAVPVAILPQRDEKGQLLDLSYSILRSVSPIHIEYLKNMGVRASMSISIIVDGELWGLFACHHYSAKSPSFEIRSVCELFSQMYSLRLESRERKEVMDYERRARDISDQLLGAVATNEMLLNDPEWLAGVLTDVIPAEGVGVWINGNYAFWGITPSTEQFARIVRALNTAAATRVFATDEIASLVPEAKDYTESAAGMLAIPISRSPRDYVILFRRELVRSVRWAGDPHKPVEYGPNGPRLTPRESFAEWQQLVQGHSKPFSAPEKRVAETLRATLIEVVLRLAGEASAQRDAANRKQEVLIAELNHRVRNILGVIRGLIRQAKPSSDKIEDFVDLVDGRIHALARAHNQITDDHWGPAPIGALIDAEARAFLGEENRGIHVSGEPVLLNPQAYSTMALVVHELVTNSTKYGSLSSGGHVDISWSRAEDGGLVFEWQERGGPPVVPPSRKGFGTTIIGRSVPYDLGGQATIDYAPSGVRARFQIPARHVSETAGPQPPARLRQPRHSPSHPTKKVEKEFLAGHRVLLVEDSLIIALDAEDILTRLGAEVMTASSVESGLEIIDNNPPTLAVLDINLGDQTSFTVADRLAEMGTPFIFATGYGEQAMLPDHQQHRTVVQKPYTLEGIARILEELIAEENLRR